MIIFFLQFIDIYEKYPVQMPTGFFLNLKKIVQGTSEKSKGKSIWASRLSGKRIHLLLQEMWV